MTEGEGVVPGGLPDTFVPPTVLGRVRRGSEVEQHEVFGPLLSAAPFATDAEAIERANGTTYGLNATVFTSRIDGPSPWRTRSTSAR